ncbi:MAG: relaxase, partial [Oscillospiraceae bacterium]
CKGKGLENWANKQNLKTMAKSFNFLTENSNTSLGDLENQITEQLDKISNLGAEIKKIEQRQKDINDYQNHIRT